MSQNQRPQTATYPKEITSSHVKSYRLTDLLTLKSLLLLNIAEGMQEEDEVKDNYPIN